MSNFRDKLLLLSYLIIKNNMSIGDNLRIVRNKKNISQREIADFLGIDRKTYVSWESGAVNQIIDVMKDRFNGFKTSK